MPKTLQKTGYLVVAMAQDYTQRRFLYSRPGQNAGESLLPRLHPPRRPTPNPPRDAVLHLSGSQNEWKIFCLRLIRNKPSLLAHPKIIR